MKRKYTFSLALQMILLLVIFICRAEGATIHSIINGGNWNVTGTWQEGQVPLSTDDVIIITGATVNTILSLSVYGNIIYTGSEWSNYKVSLAGSAAQQITFLTGNIFTGSNFIVEGTVRTITGNTSLSFSNTLVDFNSYTLAFVSNCKLTINGQSLNHILLTGTNNELEMTNSATLLNSTLYNTTLKGVIAVATGTNHFSGAVIVNAGAYLENYGTSHTIYIDGSITNNGTVTNGSNNLTLYITGDITNNNVWDNYETDLSGTSDQHITGGNGNFFSGSSFYNLNCQTKTIIALSDIEFRGTNVNFGSGAPGSVRGDFVLPEGKFLKASGGGTNHYVTRLNLKSAVLEAKLWLETGQYLSNFSNNSSVLTLIGLVQAGNSEIYLSNNVSVLDTLMNYGSAHYMSVTGNLTNLGYILNGSSTLDIQVTGNITHYGTAWSNNKVTLTGTSAQSITCAPFSIFTGTYFDCNAAHVVNILTNVEFQGTQINFQNSTVVMTSGTILTISGAGSKITNSTVNGDFTLNSSSNAYISSLTFGGSVTLQGTTQIYNNVIYFNGAAENQGTLQNQNLSGHTVYLNSHFTNNGTVHNGTGMGNLMMELKGNIINNGTWNNYSCTLNGTTDQHVRLVNDQPVNCTTTLVTPAGGNNYQWYKNGYPILGATSCNLVLPMLSTAQYGMYYNTSTYGESRHFTIQKYMTVDFTANPLTGCNPQNVNFTDNSISTYDIQSWYWEFGDGGTSGQKNPSHPYQDTGTYSVSLTISDGYISRKTTKSGYITIRLTPVADFSNTVVCLGTVTNFTDLTTEILYTTTNETQYANSVIGFSSQYSATNWAATQALGAPDVYPNHVDDVHAWASLTENNQREYLELSFANARQVNKVIIYETLYLGSIDTVYVKNPSTQQWVMVWSGTAEPQPLVARAFEVSFPLTSFSTSQVRIAINSPVVPYWNEIDAVALINPLSTAISDQTTYLWNVGENGVTFTTKGNISYTYQTFGDHNASLTVTNNGLCIGGFNKNVHVYPLSVGGSVTGGSRSSFSNPSQ